MPFFAETNIPCTAQINIADSNAIDNKLFPYDWYKEFVVTGSIWNELAAEYISQLKSIACIRDPDEVRRIKNYSILSGKQYFFVASF